MDTRKGKSECATIEDALQASESRMAQHWLRLDIDDDYDSEFETREANDEEFSSSDSGEDTTTDEENVEFDINGGSTTTDLVPNDVNDCML